MNTKRTYLLKRTAIASALTVALVGGLATLPHVAATPQPVHGADGMQQPGPTSFSAVVKRVKPAVVNISTQGQRHTMPGTRGRPFDDFLQIDAPINRGNSGGPLFDTQGRVVGINTAIYSPGGGNVGIGFAIPANMAGDVIAQLKTLGSVARGWLGVQIQAITEAVVESLGLKNQQGALVAGVIPDRPRRARRPQAG